jgi:glycerol-3-phosphate dehydrogenase
MKARWTENALLNGGDLGTGGLVNAQQKTARDYPWLPALERTALVRRHGANLPAVLAGASSLADLGACFGPGLYAREVDWFITEEWATTAEDVLWRRTKCGLHLTPAEQHAVATYMTQRVS